MVEPQWPNILALAPYRGPWECAIYPGRVVPADCGHQAWLSPQGEPYFAVEGCTSQCMDCYNTSTALADDNDVRVVPGAVEQIRQLHGDEFTQNVMDFMRSHGIKETPNE